MKLSDLSPGDIIIADDGFGCMKPGPHTVCTDNSHPGEGNPLYVICLSGQHFLDGQEDENGELVGFSFPVSS